eukprot:TRINITY_DN558_c0_g1_i2.p2 TRINITY_DN558_c0_g1~~TRINITY_DN558_c0_g1_i2.p2  ORF type:complete len:388 (-),score=97.86 TRINITY_DN558_c0_g1_i2:435-1598(-)
MYHSDPIEMGSVEPRSPWVSANQLALAPELAAFTREGRRVVAIRYFMTVTHPDEGSLVKWKDPPHSFTGVDLRHQMDVLGIDLCDHLPQVYEAELQGYSNLDHEVKFVFQPDQLVMLLNVRLTPLRTGQLDHSAAQKPHEVVIKNNPLANPGCLGLFAFALTTGFLMLEVCGAVENAFAFTIIPCALMFGGLVQLLVGMWEIQRNNLFGAVAFTSYGAFWMTYFFEKILYQSKVFPAVSATYPKGETAYYVMWGLLTTVFFFQTLRITYALQTVFFLVALTFFLLAGGVWSANCKKAAGIAGVLAASAAFYTGAAEFTNDLYKRTIIPLGHVQSHKPQWGNSLAGAGAVLKNDTFGIVGLRTRAKRAGELESEPEDHHHHQNHGHNA